MQKFNLFFCSGYYLNTRTSEIIYFDHNPNDIVKLLNLSRFFYIVNSAHHTDYLLLSKARITSAIKATIADTVIRITLRAFISG